MHLIDFTIDSRYTNKWRHPDREATGEEITTAIKRGLAKLLNISPGNIYLVGNIKPWYFLTYLFSKPSDRYISVILENENLELISFSRVIRRLGYTTQYINIPTRLDETVFKKLPIDRVHSITTTLIQPITGRRVQIENISKYLSSNGISLYIDGSYATGAWNIDIPKYGIDIYLSEGCYWLGGTRDTGFIYIRDGLLDLPNVETPLVGDSFIETISLQQPINKYASLKKEIEEILKIGLEKVKDHILNLTGVMIDGLNRIGYKVYTPLEREYRGGIVTIEVGEKAKEISRWLRDRHSIYLDKIGSKLRISLKRWHTEADVNRFLETMKKLSF